MRMKTATATVCFINCCWCVLCCFIIIIRPHRSTAYVDVAYCYRPSSVVCLSACLSVAVVSPAKMAEPIEMLFGLRTLVGPRMGVQMPHGERQFWGGKGQPIVKYRDTAVSCAKTAKLIKVPFGLRTWMGATNHVLVGGSRSPHVKGQFLGERTCWACPTTLCRELCKNGLTNRDAVWEVGIHWHKLANSFEPSMCGGDAAFCQITLSDCYWWRAMTLCS